jgi:DNA-directed RNA polymerase specialized sigma24 family protein
VRIQATPQADSLIALHFELLAGNPVATEKIVTAALDSIIRILRRRHFLSRIPSDAITDAATDAMLTYFGQPGRYDPSRGELITYLVTIADFRVKDWLRSQSRRDGREISVGGTVELALYETIYPPEQREFEEGPGINNPDRFSPELDRLVLEILPDARDRCVLSLIVAGRTEVEMYASALGISELPPAERRAAVKRNRDRVLKRLQRRRHSFELARGSAGGG